MATDVGEDNASRRKSARVSHRPQVFSQEHHEGSIPNNKSVKRKRVVDRDGAGDPSDENDDDDDNDEQGETEASEDEGEEDEPDEEELREKRRAQKRRQPAAKPANKRAKTTNGASTTLAFRSANVQSKPPSKNAKTKQARARPSQAQQEGLYAEVFGKGNSADDAASVWLETLKNDNVAAIRDLVNFMLQCAGCEVKVENQDIEDIDNVPSRLGDIVEEYAQDRFGEYPLISRLKQHQGMKTVLMEFFQAVIQSLHASAVLYDDPAVYDNVHVWVATMSGAGYRSFRHTATVISLSMSSALCEVAQELQGSMANARTQLETEKKKKNANKGRISSIQTNMKSEETRLEAVDALLGDAFDTVYVHRYRDVDEKIRVECVAALGNWIVTYRKMFLEGQYLRYLGWVLSDPNSPTRLEVVRQLKALFRSQRNIPALRAFTDRFRSRIVEMGARDNDISVRAETIELLDRLRNAELLEPDDIDTIGRLVFDTELRVRKAVAKFFVSNIEDLYKSSIEDMDDEQYKEALPEPEDVDDFLNPNQAWIKYKCLAQTLASYDIDDASNVVESDQRPVFEADESDSRYMLATQSIFPHMSELHRWQSLAGYLLYDHSSIISEADNADFSLAVQAAYKLNTGEDILLLDVLFYSVKLHLQSITESPAEKKGRRTQANKDDMRQKQEDCAHNLRLIIPQLMSKFGSTPQGAASILRLEQLLDINLVNDLENGEGTYGELLDDINKQFASHSDRKVLAEASRALRTARTYEQSREAADTKLAQLWHDAGNVLRDVLKGKSADTRGTLDRNDLNEAVNTTARLANLASVSDCTEILEAPAATTKQKGRTGQGQPLVELVLQLVNRGVPDDATAIDIAEKEDQICLAAITVLSLYFRWKIVALRTAITKNDTSRLETESLTTFAMQRSSFIEVLDPVITSRPPLDQVRISALLTSLDLFMLFATVRHMRPEKGELDEDVLTNLSSLTTEVAENIQVEVMLTHEKMEKSFARKTHRKIDLPEDKKQRNSTAEVDEDDIEKPPEDSDDEDADSDAQSEEEETQEGQSKEARKQAVLLAEQSLCELTSKIVLSVIAGVFKDGKLVKERLQVNRTKLGKSYGQVVAYLDEKKEKKGKRKSDQSEKAKEKERGKKKPTITPMVVEDDDIEDDATEMQGVGGEEEQAEALEEQELADDEIEDVEGGGEEVREAENPGEQPQEDDDEIMGD